MKKFRFRLEVLIDIRKRREEKIALELAEQNRLILNEHNTLTRLHNELKSMQENEKKKRSAENNIVTLRYSVAYRFKLKQDMLKAGKKIDEFKENVYRIQKKLMVATRDRKAVELIREKRRLEWIKECKVKEQDFIDDIAQRNYSGQTGIS